MKKHKILHLSFIIITIMMISCEEYLDRKPLTQIGNDDYWQSAEDLKNYTLQFYPVFPAFNNVGTLILDYSVGMRQEVRIRR